MRERIVNAVKRRVFVRRFAALPIVPRDDLVQLGDGYGSWTIATGPLPDAPLCWCAGAGTDVTFDLTLMREHGARVRCFDPFDRFGEMALQQADGDPRFTFHVYAIGATDGEIEMQGRQDEEHGSVSAHGIFEGSTFMREARRIDTLHREFGDPPIDLLKIDIEGSEYEVIETHDFAALGVRVLCIEFHHHNAPFSRARAAVDRLAGQGFALVHCVDRDLTFVRDGAAG